MGVGRGCGSVGVSERQRHRQDARGEREVVASRRAGRRANQLAEGVGNARPANNDTVITMQIIRDQLT